MFEKHGRRAPQPVADAEPPDYRRELFAIAQSMLPSGHWLAKVDPSETGTAIAPMEKLLFDACEAEAEAPTGDNLPDSVDHPRAKLERVDSATGEKSITWRARASFIKDLGTPAHRVLRLLNPRNGKILMGPPMPRDPLMPNAKDRVGHITRHVGGKGWMPDRLMSAAALRRERAGPSQRQCDAAVRQSQSLTR